METDAGRTSIDDVLPGTLSGRFQVHEVLGRGAMGVVYRAWDSVLGRPVALKTMTIPPHATAAAAEELRQRFGRERSAGSRLRHPNIVSILDSGPGYIAMELVDGETLAAVLSRGPLTPWAALLVLDQIAAALDHAHAAGVVHRDVKPSNILLDAEGKVKVADFGIAKLVGATSGLTRDIVGTPLYMAPEQLRGTPITAASDTFALAVLAYELLTSRHPFAADTLPSIMSRILHEDPPPASRFNPSLPPEVDDVLRWGMAKDPARRPVAAEQLVAALRTAMVAGMAFDRPAPSTATEVPEPRRRWWPPVAAIGLGIVGISLLLGRMDGAATGDAMPRRSEPSPVGREHRSEAAVPLAPLSAEVEPASPVTDTALPEAPRDVQAVAPVARGSAAGVRAGEPLVSSPPSALSAGSERAPGDSIAEPAARRTYGIDVFDGSAPVTGGAVVRRVAPGSPAAVAGLRPKDAIIAWNGAPVSGSTDVPAADTGAVEVDVLRDVDAKLVRMKLTVPATAEAPPAKPEPEGGEHEMVPPEGSSGAGSLADPDGAGTAPADGAPAPPAPDVDPGGRGGDPPDPGPVTADPQQ